MLEDLQRHAGKFYGKYSGTVTGNKDDAHSGRIKVKVPAVFGDTVEVSARPCLPYGHFFVPPEGANVWVEFEAGDPGYPIWVGVWYPNGKTPQEAAISPPDNRVVQTASGHTIEIMDKADEEKITIRHADNSFVTLDKNGSVLIGNKSGSLIALNADNGGNVMVVEQHGNAITMRDDGIVIVFKDGKAMLEVGKDRARIAAKSIVLQGGEIVLGGGPAAEPTIMGKTFSVMYLAHVHPTALGPSGPPVPSGPPLGSAPGTGLTSAVLVT